MADTVTVACKLPHGLKLDLIDPKAFESADPKGGMMMPTQPVQSVVIRGNAQPRGVDPRASAEVEDRIETAGGFALTHGVSAEFWEAWLKQNENYPPVKQGLIFALPKQEAVVSKAKNERDRKSGLEGLDPEKPAPGIQKADKKG